jgi:hypothetical protein
VEARAERGGSPIERVEVAERPPLTLVARSGDPRPAVAFVAAHARGSAVSAALAGLVGARLEAAGVTNVDARAHALGFEMARLVDSGNDAARFIQAVRDALALPVTASEPALARARREVLALKALTFAGPGDAAAAACSGELGLPDGTPSLELTTPAGIARLESAREAVFRVPAAAFAALGPEAVLDAAAHALSGVAAWPGGSADADAWPERDLVSVDNGAGARRLTLALRVGSADAAIGAGLSMGTRHSKLLERLATLNPPWRLERASAIARRRGGCLRLDLTPPPGPGASAVELGTVAALVEHAADEALSVAEPGALDESVLRPSDPLRAAALAAWRALPSEVETAPPRSVVLYVGEPTEHTAVADLTRSLAAARARLGRPSFEVVHREESGQGELYLLLASACGTVSEDQHDAGALGLLLRTIAASSTYPEVRFEPWVSADGAGLLVHAPRHDAMETPEEQARRVAAALGQALAARLNGNELGAARNDLLEELGGRPYPGWALSLDGLAPGHPSWLEPRGTWASVADLPTPELERARRTLLAGPLRFAVLAGRGEAQAGVAAQELESWLLPLRTELAACNLPRIEGAHRGEARYENPSAGAEGAYVGMAFEPAGAAAAEAAELVALALNRSAGTLERALSSPELSASARAQALGGTRRPALAIEIRATPARLEEAVARVRDALEGIARGGWSGELARYAAQERARSEAASRFDPRRRIVELWRGAKPETSEPALRAIVTSSLSKASHWVVIPARTP